MLFLKKKIVLTSFFFYQVAALPKGGNIEIEAVAIVGMWIFFMNYEKIS